MLDLRANGGGLVEEAQLIASIFIPKRHDRRPRAGARSRRRRSSATGDAIPASIPVVVLVDANTASASEIVTAALQDHHRATVVGTHTFGKGVFQEEEPLSNGGALDITVGEYFTPERPQPRRRRRQAGRGHHPRSAGRRSGVDTPHGLAVALDTLAAKVAAANAEGERPSRIVAVLERRGRFWSAEPLFATERARRGAARSRVSARSSLGSQLGRGAGATARDGDIVLVRARRGAARRRRASCG